MEISWNIEIQKLLVWQFPKMMALRMDGRNQRLREHSYDIVIVESWIADLSKESQ